MWRKLSESIREVQRSYGGALSSYRPDLHYMRGPGPKWHAKYGDLAGAATNAESAEHDEPNLAAKPAAG
jgi:hypothetical protein